MPITHARKPPRSQTLLRSMLPAVVGILTVWAALFWQFRSDTQQALKHGHHASAEVAISFSEQLDDLLAQSDHLLLSLVYLIKHGASEATIQNLLGSLPEHSWLNPAFIDPEGTIRIARNPKSVGASVADQTFFKQLQEAPTEALGIHPPARGVGAMEGRTVVRLTRQTRAGDGSLAGIWSIAVPDTVLTSFRNAALMGPVDVVMVGRRDGALLANSVTAGDEPQNDGPAARVFDKLSQASSLSEAQPVLEVEDEFFVARSGLLRQPIDVVIALARQNVLAPLEKERVELMFIGVLTALVLLSLSGAAAWRKTSQLNARERAQHVRAVFRQAVDDSKDELFMLAPLRSRVGAVLDFRIEECNFQASRSYGRTREAMVGHPLSSLLSEANWSVTRDFLGRAMMNGFAETEAHFYRDGWKEKRWMTCRATLVEDGLAVTMRDITDLKEKEAQLEQLALTDGLTGLPNRHWINRELPQLLKQAGLAQQYIAALFIDLDNFKSINDTLGHQTGDDYLKAVAAGVRQVIRKNDVVVRLGGDEFLVLALGLEDSETATKVATSIIDRIRDVSSLGRWSSANPRASVGIAAFPVDARSANELVQAADIAMYEAKRNGKDRFEIFVPTMRERLREEFNLEAGLRKAVANGGFSLRFQPRASAVSGKLIGFEALARWDDPVVGSIPPARFIPVAEKHDLIDELGCWVIEEVCKTLVQWRDSNKLLHPVSVNISAKQLKTPKLREHLQACVKRFGIPPSQIELELTESTMVADDPAIKRELRLLGEMGHKLMIDDFGTGYSSLAQLQQLRVDVLKIDADFVRNLSSGDEGRLICKAMIQIGKTLGIDVVAEGVETRHQLEELQRFGCDEVQGFLLAKPLPADQALALLDQRQLFAPDTLEPVSRETLGSIQSVFNQSPGPNRA